MHDGNIAIARRFAGTVVLLNIGLISRMTIIDRTAGVTLLDSDTGPGMTLINRCAREINCPDGFDRDGSEAAKGILDITVLDSLATSPWFMKEAPKEAAAGIFDALMQKPALMALAPHDKLAVLTALTARTIHDFYRKNYKQPSVPEIVVVSGGGANNQSLMKYLSTYFGALPLKNCEELGIPVEMRFPLSIGLSVDAFLMGKQGTEIGRVTLP
jgi:anhydro-N-acetylmuramic acid kinase